MSQAGNVSVAGGGGVIQFNEDTGSAVPAAGVINVLGGTGISTVGAGNTITINATDIGTDWTVVVGAAQNLVAGNGYINSNVGLTTFTLPALAVVGATFQILGQGAGGWTIAQNAGQTIHVSGVSSTPGVGGSVASANLRDCIELVCSVANTEFTAVDFVGTLTIV